MKINLAGICIGGRKTRTAVRSLFFRRSNYSQAITSSLITVRALCLGLILVVFFAGRLSADEIFTYTMDTSAGTPRIRDSLHVNIGVLPAGGNSISLFDFQWTTNDVGTTYTASEDNSENFNPFVATVTNGISDTIQLRYGLSTNTYYNGTMSSPEPFFFYGSTSDPRIDLAGQCIIESISVTLNALSFETPGRDPNGNGIWTDCAYTYTLSIDGVAVPVPEPSTIGLVGLGLISIWGIRRKVLCHR